MNASPDGGNLLIAALPPEAREGLLRSMTREPSPLGEPIFRQGAPITRVHFPLTCVLSLVTTLQDGATIEFSTVGNEGTTGLPVFLGDGVMANARCVSQIAGESLVIDAADFRAVCDRSPDLQQVLKRYSLALITQVGQAVACSSLHTTRQRAARWLLMSRDRVEGDRFHLTHEFLSFMLGVRRASVTQAVGYLQEHGWIRYKRGDLEITDRAGLEAQACECYGVMRAAFEQPASS